MHLIVCLDKRGGMSFFGKRQSQDSEIRADILNNVERVYMSAYSARQFKEESEKIVICEDYLTAAGENDYCFSELEDITEALCSAKTVTVYCFNRDYPFDKAFPVADYKKRWKCLSRNEFAGSSHEKITKEIYQL